MEKDNVLNFNQEKLQGESLNSSYMLSNTDTSKKPSNNNNVITDNDVIHTSISNKLNQLNNTKQMDMDQDKDKKSTKLSNLPTESKKETIPFWTQNPNIIFDKEYLLEFFPVGEMTFNQKLNAITRSILILTILGLFITKNQIQLVFIGFISILAVIAMFEYYKKSEGFDLDSNFGINFPDPALDYLAQSNLLDSNIPIFQKPDSMNPYGNVLVSDYELNPQKLPAPPVTNAAVSDMVTDSALKMVKEANPGQPDITDKLFRDLNEQLNFEQMNRQFVSNPATTIPNDQGAFAEFCYGSMISCKEGNLFACARNTSHYTNY